MIHSRAIPIRFSFATQRAIAVGFAIAGLCTSVCDAASDTQSGRNALSEVLVSARKRIESSDHVPIAVRARTSAELDDGHVGTLADAALTIPGVGLHNTLGNGNPVLVIRGIGLQDFNANNTPTAGVYFDEVYLPSTAMADITLFDIDSVEILKGPQGTLWGRNTLAGAVQVRTIAPTPDFHAGLNAELARFGERRIAAFINGALRKQSFGRLSFDIGDRAGGWFKTRPQRETRGRYTRWAARGQFETQLTDDTRLHITAQGGTRRGDGYLAEHVGLSGANCSISNLASTLGLRDDSVCVNAVTGYSDPDGDPDVVDEGFHARANERGNFALVRLDHDSDGARFSSLTAWQQFSFDHAVDADASPARIIDLLFRSRINSVSEELRLASIDAAARFTWLVGVSASEDRHTERRRVDLSDFLPGIAEQVALDYDQRTVSIAGFGDAQYALTPRLKALAGLRYTHDALDFDGGAYPVPGRYNPITLPLVFPGLPSIVSEHPTFSDVSGRIGLAWQIHESSAAYATLSRGFKSGGVFGGFGLTSVAFTPYSPEHLYALEFGLKQTLSPRMRLEANAFLYRDEDLQAVTLVKYTFGVVPQLTNVGNARVHGLEATLFANPGGRLSLEAGVVWLATEVTSSAPAVDSLQRPLDLNGHELSQAPHWSVNMRVRYAQPIGNELTLKTALSGRHQTSYFADLQNQRHLAELSPTTLLTLRIALTRHGRPWEASIWGDNLTNERIVTYGNSSGGGNDLIFRNAPRTWGAGFSYRW